MVDYFFYNIPSDHNPLDYGFDGSSVFNYNDFKNIVYDALVYKYGLSSIQCKNKCFVVIGNTYRIKADIVPTFEYREYSSLSSFTTGTKYFSSSDEAIINFPKQHLENGIIKNKSTQRRYKRLVRIFKKLHLKMAEASFCKSENITSFLIESLIWNIPDDFFTQNKSWRELIFISIVYLYQSLEDENKYRKWGEVSDLLYLFHQSRKWSVDNVKDFLIYAFIYLGFHDNV